MGLVGGVPPRVPARRREVEAAREGDRVVHHDDLLVLGGAQGMIAVQAEVEARMAGPHRPETRQRLALEGVDHGEIPVEDVDVQVGPAVEHRVQEAAEGIGRIV